MGMLLVVVELSRQYLYETLLAERHVALLGVALICAFMEMRYTYYVTTQPIIYMFLS